MYILCNLCERCGNKKIASLARKQGYFRREKRILQVCGTEVRPFRHMIVVGATWFRREQMWRGLHVEDPIILVNHGRKKATDTNNYALAA